MMKKEILISLEANEKRVVILDNGKLEDFFIERTDSFKMFGNIYKGRVKSVVPGIGAAFVDLGTKKDGFLYVGDAVESSLNGDSAFDDDDEYEAKKDARRMRPSELPRIENVLKTGQEVIVQVVKEAIRDKGPRLTTHFAIPARYLVLMPGEQKVGISRRIDSASERDRIRKIFSGLNIPKGIGFIVRTVGANKDAKEFDRDVRYLTRIWSRIKANIQKLSAPSLVHKELDLVERTIRDYYTEDMARVVVDHKDLYHQLQRFVRSYVPGTKVKIELTRSRMPLFEKFKIEKEIERTFHKKVYLRSGGHIVIEQTEGLVAIDVNTGKFTGRRDLEETVYRTNLEAAVEVARQIRLRDMGGIIIIDFIDMTKADHRLHLYRMFRDAVRKDRAKTNILEMSELGLIEMTRQRIRPSLESAVYDACPYCEGKGTVKSATTMCIETIKEIRKSMDHFKGKVVNVYIHPQVAERFDRHEMRIVKDIERQSNSRIILLPDPSLHREDSNITLVQ